MPSLPLSVRLREGLGAPLLLLLLLVTLAALALTQASLLTQDADQWEDTLLPKLRHTQDVRRLLDEARGLESLQFLTEGSAARADGIALLQRHRRLVEAQLAAVGPQGEDDEERRLKALVQERLAAYWAAQDRVLAALAQSADGPAAAGAAGEGSAAAATAAATDAGATPAASSAAPAAELPARLLLARESQDAWTAVSQALVYWYQHQEQRALALAGQSRSQAMALRWGTVAVLGPAVALVLGLRWGRRRARFAHVPAAPSTWSPNVQPLPGGLPETLDSIAMHSRLVALNAAVQAARSGQPSEADRAERAHLAVEAEALARRCDDARRRMRMGSRTRAKAPAAELTGNGPGPGAG